MSSSSGNRLSNMEDWVSVFLISSWRTSSPKDDLVELAPWSLDSDDDDIDRW